MSLTESLAIKSDNTGRPEVISISCAASVGNLKVRFNGGARLENPDMTMEVIINVILSTLNTPLITMFFFFCYYSSWLYNLFSKYINRALKNALEKQVCDDSFLPVLLVCCRFLIGTEASSLNWNCSVTSAGCSSGLKFVCAPLLQICPLVNNAISDMNPRLKTLNGETSAFGQMFLYLITPEELTEILPYCSFS